MNDHASIARLTRQATNSGEEILSPDGMFVVGKGGDDPGQLWRLSEKADHKPVVLENSGFSGSAFSPDGKKLVTQVVAKLKRRTATGFQVLDLTGALPKVERVVEAQPEDRCWDTFCFSSDGELLAGAGSDANVALLPLTERKRQQLGLARGQTYRKQPLTSPTRRLTFLPGDKTMVLSGGECDQGIRFFDLETGKERFRQAGHRSVARIGDLARDGRTLATGGANGEVRLWDLTAPQREKAVLNRPFELKDRRNNGWVGDQAFSPDGRFLLTVWGGVPEPLRIWDLSKPNPGKPKVVPLGSFQAWNCLVSPDGKSAAILGAELLLPEVPQKGQPAKRRPAVQLWAWKDGNLQLSQRLAVKNPDPDDLSSVFQGSYSPDGKLLAFQVGMEEIQIWDVRSVPARHKASIACSANADWLNGSFTFSADGRQLVTVCTEVENVLQQTSEVRLRWWDLGGEKPIQRKVWVEKDNAFCLRLAMSPDGQFLAVANWNGLCVWSAAEGKKIKSWRLPGRCCNVRFAPDSRHLLTGNANGSIYVWRVAQPKARTP